MPLLNFGQPVGGVIQVAFAVEDIALAMRGFTDRLKVGPWFVSGPSCRQRASTVAPRPTCGSRWRSVSPAT